MATVTYARPTYRKIIQSILEQINEKERLTTFALETGQLWILEACQQITQELSVEERRQLRLVQSQQDYLFQDTTGTITGTGQVNVTGINVAGTQSNGTGTVSYTGTVSTQAPNNVISNGQITGVGTTFRSQLQVGQMITVGTESHMIVQIQSDTVLLTDQAWAVSFTGSAFTFSTTRFTRELVTGSQITIGANTLTIASITDGDTATVVAPLAVDVAAQSFTINTNVQEIPTRMRNGITIIDRIESGFHREVKVVPIRELLQNQKEDLYPVYTNYNTPYECAIFRDEFQRYYLHFYTSPDVDKEVTLYTEIKITPRLYLDDTTVTLDSQIPLDEDFEPLLRLYTESMIWGWLKNYDLQERRHVQFEAKMNQKKGQNRLPRRMQTTYR